MRAARLRPARTCIAIGDSREDMGAAEVVGTFWLVANGRRARPDARARHSPRTCASREERNGAGVYEAVITELAERRG